MLLALESLGHRSDMARVRWGREMGDEDERVG